MYLGKQGMQNSQYHIERVIDEIATRMELDSPRRAVCRKRSFRGYIKGVVKNKGKYWINVVDIC